MCLNMRSFTNQYLRLREEGFPGNEKDHPAEEKDGPEEKEVTTPSTDASGKELSTNLSYDRPGQP